ncbi:MAG TPA: hypothetical protein VL225_19470 [Vicinamibacterales bacterium]|nr:hypothetical protein [Vicinamibacterales bacterium]
MFAQPTPPIIVRVVEQPVHKTSLADIIFGSLGLVGVLLIAAAVCGLVLAGIVIGIKRLRRTDGLDSQTDDLRVTPTS